MGGPIGPGASGMCCVSCVRRCCMHELPRGTVTMLFTDIEGSTRLLQQVGRADYVEALEAHRRLLREAFIAHGGMEVEMQGDSFHFAFPTARGAVTAAAAGQ